MFVVNIMDSSGDLCVTPITSMQRLLTGLITPLIGFAQVFLLMGMHRLIVACGNRFGACHNVFGRCLLAQGANFNYASYIRTICGLGLFSCKSAIMLKGLSWSQFKLSSSGLDNSFAGAMFKYFSCTQVLPGFSVLTHFPSVDCESSERLQFMPLFVIVVAVIATAPLVLLIVLAVHYRKGWMSNEAHGKKYGIL